MDLVDEADPSNPYDPAESYEFTAGPMTPQEQEVVTGVAVAPAIDEDLVPEEEVW